jgi:hypothetical protein
MNAPTRPAFRVDLDPDDVARGFANLVLALAEVVRELLERQAIRRIDAGDLDQAQIERLGNALLAVRRQLAQLHDSFDEPRRGPESGKTETRKDVS